MVLAGTTSAIACLMLMAFSRSLDAQPLPRIGEPVLFLGVGAFDYSLGEDGRSAMFAGRLERGHSTRVIGEAGFLYARVRERGSDESANYLVPEIQVQVQMRSGRFAPYLGVGGGLALDFRPDSMHTNATASASLGVRAWFSNIAALRSEFRVRAVSGGRGSGGTSRELVIGLLMRFIDPTDRYVHFPRRYVD